MKADDCYTCKIQPKKMISYREIIVFYCPRCLQYSVITGAFCNADHAVLHWNAKQRKASADQARANHE